MTCQELQDLTIVKLRRWSFGENISFVTFPLSQFASLCGEWLRLKNTPDAIRVAASDNPEWKIQSAFSKALTQSRKL